MAANPIGNPYANPQETDGYGPALMEWLRKQAMDQMITQQAMDAQANSSAFGPQNPALMQTLPVAPQPQAPQPMVPQQGVAPQPVPQQMPQPTRSMPVQPPGMAPQPTGQMPQPDGFTALATSMPADVMPGPPRTPEEREQRKAGWQAFMQKVQSDPTLQGMLMKIGTEMMQPIQPHQSGAGHFAQAFQSGIDYRIAQQEMKRKALLEGRRDVREEKTTESGLQTEDLARDVTRREESRKAVEFPERMRQLQQQIRMGATDEQLKAAELEHTEWIKGWRDKQAQMGLDKDQALIDYYDRLGKAAIATAKGKSGKDAYDMAEKMALVNRLNWMIEQRAAEEEKQYPNDPDKRRTKLEILEEISTDMGNTGLLEEYLKAHAYFGIAVPPGFEGLKQGDGSAKDFSGAPTAKGPSLNADQWRAKRQQEREAKDKSPKPQQETVRERPNFGNEYER